MLSRRGLIFGAAASLVAAPAIVRAANLMPIKVLVDDGTWATKTPEQILLDMRDMLSILMEEHTAPDMRAFLCSSE